MTDFIFNCPHCQQSLKVSEDMSGHQIHCPSCDGEIEIPGTARPSEQDSPPSSREEPSPAATPPSTREAWASAHQSPPSPLSRGLLITLLLAFAVALSVGALYFFLQSRLPLVQALPCNVQSDEFFAVSGFLVQVLDTNVKLPKSQKSNASQPRMVSLQWRCDLKNISTRAVRYVMKTELLDKDGYVLATSTVESKGQGSPNRGQGDLPPGQTHKVDDVVLLGYLQAKNLGSSRITLESLKTGAQLQKEREEELAQQKAEMERELKIREQEQKQKEADERLKLEQAAKEKEEQAKRAAAEIELQKQFAEAARQKQIDDVKEKWRGLQKGMSKEDVKTLLGKPVAVIAHPSLGDIWEYPPLEGAKSPKVEFTPEGEVKGWRLP